MPFNLIDLDDETRARMLTEFDADLAAGAVLESAVVAPSRAADYFMVQRRAFAEGDPDIRAEDIASSGILLPYQKNGNRVNPLMAAKRLAGGQFGAYYARAVALRAAEEGLSLEIYRARPSSNPRPESEMKIGQNIEPLDLLSDLRANSTSPGSFAVLPEVNSGLSVKLVR